MESLQNTSHFIYITFQYLKYKIMSLTQIKKKFTTILSLVIYFSGTGYAKFDIFLLENKYSINMESSFNTSIYFYIWVKFCAKPYLAKKCNS